MGAALSGQAEIHVNSRDAPRVGDEDVDRPPLHARGSVAPVLTGVDIAAPPGTPTVAAASGTVLSAGPGWRNNGGGWVVELQHAGGLTTAYTISARLAWSPGSASIAARQSVARAAPVSAEGRTFSSTSA